MSNTANTPATVFIGSPHHNFSRPIPAPPAHHDRDSTDAVTRPAQPASRRADDGSSEIPTSTGEGEISTSSLFVRPSRSAPRAAQPPKSPARAHDLAHFLSRPHQHQHQRTRQARTTLPSQADSEPDYQLEGRHLLAQRQRTLSSGAATSRPFQDPRRGRQTCSENGETSWGPRPRVLSLPRHAHRTPSNSDSSEAQSPLTPNGFNVIPPMPIFSRNRPSRHRPQDSGFTQQSTTSSSLYPRSSSTGTESYPSPPSLPSRDIEVHEVHIRPPDAMDPEDSPHMDELHEMDTDDVSYRLRLLMKNNYYLPPAHSKPYSDIPIFSDSPKRTPPKSASPTFMDLFKVGKRTKGTTPEAQRLQRGPNGPIPILRTTSDSSTVSGMTRTQPKLPAAGKAAGSPHARQDTKGRVVVVRERMEDITRVAKQVERDLKTREAERKRIGSEHAQSHKDVDPTSLIDPTDTVDLPPMAAGGIFGPQASALHGLGVEASIGAAQLADHLPPSSPWSDDTEEEAWRKALLQEAVGHSLNNSPAATPSRTPPLVPSPFRSHDSPSTPSPASGSAPSSSNAQGASPGGGGRAGDGAAGAVGATPRRKRDLGQKIISRMISEEDLAKALPSLSQSPTPHRPPHLDFRKPSQPVKPSSRSLRVSGQSLGVPSRAETPVAPHHPLAPPPPRRTPLTPVQSDSQTERFDMRSVQSALAQQGQTLAQGARVGTPQPSPTLANMHEAHVGLSGAFGALTPPPATGQSQEGTSSTVITPRSKHFGTVSSHSQSHETVASLSSGSHYSDDDEAEDAEFHTPMETTATASASVLDISRPSLTISVTESEYSQPSAFDDALENPTYLDGSPRLSALPSAQNSRVSSMVIEQRDYRFSAVSPPPRTSSSLAHTVLPPPPPHFRSVYNTPRSRGSLEEEGSERSPTPHADEPPTPIRPNRLRPPAPLELAEPGARGSRGSSVGGSSYPPSPISFFDAVEMQSHAEESDDDDLEDVTAVNHPQSDGGHAMAYHDVHSRASTHIPAGHPHPLRNLAQLGNRSTPQLATSSLVREGGPASAYETFDRRLPFTNVPPPLPPGRSAFLSFGKKQGKMHAAGLGAGVPAPAGRVSESMFDRLRAKSPTPGEGKRPQTAGSKEGQATPPAPPRMSQGAQSMQSWRDEQAQQDQQSRRLDGMLIEHMERERDILRRIAGTTKKS